MEDKINKIMELFLDNIFWFEGDYGELNADLRGKLHSCGCTESEESIREKLQQILAE